LGGWLRLLSVLPVLTDKPWRLEAIARLLVGILACVFFGSLVLTVLRFDPVTARSTPLIFYSLAGASGAAFLGALWFVVRPWSLDQFKLRAGLLLICAYGGLALTGAAQRSAGGYISPMTVLAMVVLSLSFQGAAIPLIWLFVRQHGIGLREGFGLNLNRRHALLMGATAAFAFIPVAFGLQFGIAMIAKFLNFDLPVQDAVLILRLADSWTDRIALGFVAVVLAPLAEEGLFRGIFYPAIRSFGYPQAAMWVTSVLFALIHFNTLTFIPLLVLAVALVKLYEKTGNLLSCIACHATFNLFNFIMLFLTGDFNASQPAHQ
jgi:uncharacterized protein